MQFVERWDGGGAHSVAWFIEKPGSDMVLCGDVTEPEALTVRVSLVEARLLECHNHLQPNFQT